MWVKAKERGKNKEKYINGAMFLTLSLEILKNLYSGRHEINMCLGFRLPLVISGEKCVV
jgi:hypothetical protein